MSVLSSLCISCRFNEDFGTYNPVLGVKELTATRQFLIYLFAITGAIFASFFSATVGSYFGRRTGLCLTGMTGAVGGILEVAANSIGVLYAGKFLAGSEL